MAGKPRVSSARLADMLGVLVKNPAFRGRITLQPDGGVEIDNTVDGIEVVEKTQPGPQGDLTPDELAGFGRSA